MFTNSKLSLQVFGVYLILVAGCGLIFIPDFILGLFGMTAGDGAWIKMVGMLASIIGAYYLVATKAEATAFYRWSIPMRTYAAGFMVFMFVSGSLSAGILIFAAVDLAGAMWTWAALRSEERLSAV